jgi:Concanavalin A-like lectin/glucanases superfamily
MSRRLSALTVTLACVMSIAFARQAFANNCVWIASGSSTFTTTTSWQTCNSTYPQSGDTVTFNSSGKGSCTISGGPFTVTSLTISSGYTGTVTVSTSLTVNGNLSIAGGTFVAPTSPSTLTIGSSGNLSITGGTYTGGTGSVSVAGSVTVNQNTGSSGSDSSLVGYWTLDDTSSPSIDSSGQGNSLSWSGSPVQTTSKPSAITFSDSGSLSMATTSGSATQQYATSSNLSGISALRVTTTTLSAWYKATAVDASGAEIVSGSNTYGLRLYANSSTDRGFMVMKRYLDNGSTADWIEYRVQVSNVLDGNWHQICGVITTGTGGGMAVYFDGVPVSGGSYWVNGSNGATQLGASSSPTSTAAASAALVWDANTETFGLTIGTNPSITGYQFGKGCSGTACAIDDVRVYNRALTDAQIAALATGNTPPGGGGVMTLQGPMSVTGSFNVQSLGSLTLSNSSAVLSIGSGSTMTVDGTLNSTGGTIQSISGNYRFVVGTSSSSKAVLNINGLNVKNTDTHGMMINGTAGTTDSASGASTTFAEFDKVSISSPATSAAQLLEVFASTLYLTANSCSFSGDSATTDAIKLVSGASSGTGPRIIFGNTTCSVNDGTTGLCATTQKADDDSGNGVPSPSTGGVVSFIRSAQSDPTGLLVGFPTAAFDWSSFTYYSTYVTFHGAASSGADTIFVRDSSGNPLYSWTDPTVTETIVGTPQWTTTGGTHYLYVAANGVAADSGVVYRLIDTGTKTTSGTLTLDTAWNATGGATSGIYSCGCTFVSNISIDANNIYAAVTKGGASSVMGILQSNGTKIAAWASALTAAPSGVSSSASPPQLFTDSGTTTLYMGASKDLLSLAVTGTTWGLNTTVTGTVTGRVSVGKSLLSSTLNTIRIYAGDSTGTVYAISPSSFTSTGTGTTSLWTYAAGSTATTTYYDTGSDTLQFGTSAGNVIVLTGAGSSGSGAKLNTTYPYAVSGAVTAAPLYYNGVLVVATSTGNLYFLDRNTGLASPNGVSIIKMVSFGTSQSISSIGFDVNSSHYLVSTSSSAQDGRLYVFDLVSDPTPSTM